MDRETGGQQSMGLQRVGYDGVTNTFTFFSYLTQFASCCSWINIDFLNLDCQRVLFSEGCWMG